MDVAENSTAKSIKVSKLGHVATISFDNYAKRNALSQSLIAEFLQALDELRSQEVRVVVLRSAAAEKVWSAGHDIDELPVAGRDPLPYEDPLEKLLRAIRAFPAPVLAMVQGGAWGGACDLIMTCDMVFGDETAAFAITPAKLGVPYNAAGIQHFLERLPLNLVTEMFCTAQPVAAEQALRIGILNGLLPADKLEDHVYKTAELIATRSPASIACFKATARALAEAMPINPENFELHPGTSAPGLLRARLRRREYGLSRKSVHRSSECRGIVAARARSKLVAPGL